MEQTVAILPLFDEEPSQPVADRLRAKLEDIVGQDHLLAPAADSASGPVRSPSGASAPPSRTARRREGHHRPAPHGRPRHGIRAGAGHLPGSAEPPPTTDGKWIDLP